MRMKTILVVGDSKQIEKFLGGLLEDFGYDTIFCTNGEEARDHICEADALITFARLPGEMNGTALRIAAKVRKPCLPVLIITSLTKDEVYLFGDRDAVIGKLHTNTVLSWLRAVLR